MQVAEEKGIHAFGWDTDMAKFGPHAQLTANMEDWGPYYIDEVRHALDGTWTGNRSARLGIREGAVVLTPLNPSIPPDVARLFEAKKQAIVAGSLLPFAGPLKDNAGALRTPAGGSLSVADMSAINWYVEGVDGTIPK
jgi:simple sugar transport system substrate-binding protein